eukprot:1157868-Pelagomonas_calceolata.AAC.3
MGDMASKRYCHILTLLMGNSCQHEYLIGFHKAPHSVCVCMCACSRAKDQITNLLKRGGGLVDCCPHGASVTVYEITTRVKGNEREHDSEQEDSSVKLSDVCYRPFTDGECAVQSVAQYWQMDRQLYRQEQGPFYTAPLPAFLSRPLDCQCSWYSFHSSVIVCAKEPGAAFSSDRPCYVTNPPIFLHGLLQFSPTLPLVVAQSLQEQSLFMDCLLHMTVLRQQNKFTNESVEAPM